MSGRFEWDGDGDSPGYENVAELFEQRARTAIYSKRGRASLRELREALMALPKHELIYGAMCRKPKELEDGDIGFEEQEAERAEKAKLVVGQVGLDGAVVEQLDPAEQYGVCGVGAYIWWKKVQAGVDPVQAFNELPELDTTDDWKVEGDEMFTTAYEGQRAGLTYTLAWEVASGNDETFASLTPPERWQAMVDWIDKVLAEPPLRRGPLPSHMKRLGHSYTY
jgi:hypothetical protein